MQATDTHQHTCPDNIGTMGDSSDAVWDCAGCLADHLIDLREDGRTDWVDEVEARLAELAAQ